MADVRHNLVVDTSQSQMSLRQMRQEMKNLQIEMSKTSDPTRFAQLEKEFAILRNDMRDTSKAMKYLDPGELLGGWIKMAQGAVGGFAAITGAMSLFGVENENLQEIEKKSMVLIQTMLGLEQARQLLIDGGGKAEQKTLLKSTIGWLGKTLGITKNTAATAANTTATVVQTTATGAQTVATGGATIATRLLGAAMKALPILAIIGAVTGLVAIFKSLSGASKKVEEAQASQKKALEDSKKSYDNLRDSIIGYKNAAEDEVLAAKVASGEISQVDADKIKSKEQFWKDFNDVNGKAWRAGYDETTRYQADLELANAEHEQNLVDAKIKYGNSVQGLNKAVAEENARHNNSIENINKIHSNNVINIEKNKRQGQADVTTAWNARDKQIEEAENKRKLEEQQRAWDAYLSALKSWRQKVEDYNISMIADNLDREEAALETKRAREIEELIKSKIYATEKQKFLLDINKYYDFELEKIENKREERRAEAFVSELKAEQNAIDKANEERLAIEAQAKAVYDLRKAWEDSNKETKKESLFRALEVEGWDIVKEKMMDYYGQGIINEEDYNKTIIDYAAKNLDANEEAYEFGLITFEEFEKNKTEIAKTENDKRIADIQKYSAAYQDVLSSANSLMSALSERELIGVDQNSRKGLEIRKKVAKQQLAMQVAMSAGLIAAGVLQAIAETGVAAPVVAAGLISLGATQVAAIIKAQNAIDQIDVEIANLADGGLVIGRGGPRSDSIPANLSNGEFVLNAAAVERLGLNLVNSLNKGASTAALIDYDLLAEKINEKQVYVTDRAITERQRTTKVTEKRTRL